MSYELESSNSILLVEDNPDDIMITKRALNLGPIRNTLYVVEDGEDALHFMKKEGVFVGMPTPSLVLLDLNMPKVDGFEVLMEIKRRENLRKIPIIVLTTSDRDVDRAYELGCNSYIVKPNSFEELCNTLGKILQYWLRISITPGDEISRV